MRNAGSDGFVRFPPRWRNVLVPIAPARAAALGTTLYTASRPLPWAAQNVLWALARVCGGRALPGPREAWDYPLDAGVVDELRRQWVAVVGREPDGVAVYQRTQAARAALTVLLCAGRHSVLVRVRRDPTSLLQERRISEAAQALRPRSITVPELAGHGSAAGWHWTAYRAMATRPHRPLYRLPRGATDEIAALVETVVPRPSGAPAGWAGAHLDVSPWNLRRAGGRTVLIDWEDAGWAPPGADAVYLEAIVTAMRTDRVRSLPSVADHPDAAAYWLPIIRAREPNPNEAHLRDRMLVLLPGPVPA
ncbi:hypothetical protein [Jatrophihabitans endophyticus]|uniref:hypothetical protein n=1 Tax=Jatrophihabitans endophyticus TaxID=1206085 RepID=UPI0019F14900|nr:hypothetical protein [Jatrophihabitans endophyticus]MBE7189594.1 phosphotransferase [Jatrophihabitans endophyticus]